MEKQSKGQITQQFILEEARKIYNVDGINLTLRELADKMGVTIGRITNYFPTRDYLFAGMSKVYQEEYELLVSNFNWESKISLNQLYQLNGQIMDLQYKHRCLLLYTCGTSINQKVMISQIGKTWKSNLGGFEKLIVMLIDAGLIKENARDENAFIQLRFQYINLFTTWLVSYTIYDAKQSYKKMKPVYQKGILESLMPYLTSKGLKQFRALSV
jgi:AcrR family transcriptional regulator